MSFANGRNEIQASIKDNADMITCIAQELNLYYDAKCLELSGRIEKVRNDNKTEPYDPLSTMLNPDCQLLDLYEELKGQTMQLLIPKIYSYAEKHIEGLLMRKSYTIKQARELYRNEKNPEGISDIEKGCYVLCKCAKLPFDEIMSMWAGFKEFHSLRKVIAHRFQETDANIDVDYITAHIDKAKALLTALELRTR